MNSIWLRSEETAWIDKVVSAKDACLFSPPDSHSRLHEAWVHATTGTTTDEPIAIGGHLYGTLSCRG
jgi:hypothetical protein